MIDISMSKLFLDTSALIALLNPRDQYHKKIKQYLENTQQSLRGVTSNLVLSELMTFFSRHGSLNDVLRFQTEMLSNPHFSIIWVDKELHEVASQILKKFSDHRLSFTDASSFAIMKRERVSCALTFDEDFKRAGFESVP